MQGKRPPPFGNLIVASDTKNRCCLSTRTTVIAHAIKNQKLELKLVVLPHLRCNTCLAMISVGRDPTPQGIKAYRMRLRDCSQTALSSLIRLNGFELLLLCVLDQSRVLGLSKFRGSDQNPMWERRVSLGLFWDKDVVY